MTIENEFTYRDKRPRVNRLEMWEVGLPNGHRLIIKVRRSRIRRPPNHIDYQGRCTCKGWKSTVFHRKEDTCRKEFREEHISEVLKQGSLF
jgi:hypothetical protein